MAEDGSLEADLWHALVLGVRDYIGKNGFPGALLGLSGGIDSALVLAVAVDALGAVYRRDQLGGCLRHGQALGLALRRGVDRAGV